LNLVYSFRPGISMSAHVGGLVAGFLCGLALAQDLTPEAAARRRARAAIVAVLAAALLAGGGAAVAGKISGLPNMEAEFNASAAVEKAGVDGYNAAIEQAQAHQIDSRECAARIERILPLWHASVERLEGLQNVPAGLRPLVDARAKYMRLREEAWRLHVEALRSDDDAKFAAWKAKQQEASEALDALDKTTEEE
jgi:hypothetical protein